MQQPLIPLNDGHKIPQLGLGVWQIPDHQAPLLIGQALEEGYGLVDTAASYGNEAGVGRAVRSARQAGRSVFVTTKLAIEDRGTTRPCAASTEASHVSASMRSTCT
jgi:2,5-diketo-D-gluconate reductase A